MGIKVVDYTNIDPFNKEVADYVTAGNLGEVNAPGPLPFFIEKGTIRSAKSGSLAADGGNAILGSVLTAHYFVSIDLSSASPKRTQETLSEWRFADGNILTRVDTEVRGTGAGSVFTVSGEITGGTGAYAAISGTAKMSGPFGFSAAPYAVDLGFYLQGPWILQW